MRVTAVRADSLSLRTRGETTDAADIGCVLVRVTTDEGLTGYGEAIPAFEYTGETVESVLGAVRMNLGSSIIGQDPFDVESIVRGWRSAAPGRQTARAGVELALWDLQGKSVGRPIYDLIGGLTRRLLPETYPFDRAELPRDALERARAVRAAGVRIFKVYLAVGNPPRMDPRREAIVGAVREGAGPDVEIRVDANGGWPDVASAVAAIHRLERWRISMVEEPVRPRDYGACRLIRMRTSTPLCLDESVLEPEDALVAIRSEACDVINVKLMKTGGILGAIKLNAIAEAAGVSTHVGNMGHSTIGVAAILHLHAALSNATSSDIDPPDRGGDLAQDIASGPVRRISDGLSRWLPPPGPGLGVTLDESAIEAQLSAAPRAADGEARANS